MASCTGSISHINTVNMLCNYPTHIIKKNDKSEMNVYLIFSANISTVATTGGD